ncbi:hypothetical protein GGF43_006106 [Coemansia sp. RSA 2618]|nr:hypothetical protein GGF43_006106 [Coemansia sp. RSA 2618]
MPAPGEGRIDCRALAGRIHQTVSSAYPLKIISPTAARTIFADGSKQRLLPAVSYILSYGGGIVHGDQIRVSVRVAAPCALMLLTQGSTKVYRNRGTHSPISAITSSSHSPMTAKDSHPPMTAMASHPPALDAGQTYQTLELHVDAHALLCLLPDPVTCFEGARYNQRQAVTMHPDGSLVLLDWMTSGRMSRGERWQFDKYLSVNTVSVARAGEGKPRLCIRDALLLERDSCAERLVGVDVFAYLLLLGPEVEGVVRVFRKDHEEQRIRPFQRARDVVQWSVSEVCEFGLQGVAVRAACARTEDLKVWIKEKLSALVPVVGDSAWSMYFNA